MPDVTPSKLSKAENEAWRYYAETKGDNWREAFDKWAELRDDALLAWTEEFTSRHERLYP